MTSKTPRFTYEKAGVKITAPNFESAMTAGFLRKHRNDNEIEQMFALVEEVLDEANLAKFDKLPVTGDAEDATMDDFYTSWQRDSGITSGE